MQAVQEFFESNHLLKAFNATLITLVPKCVQPTKVSDYRPIFCCNTFYKFIAKILANRLKSCLPSLISKNQSALLLWRGVESWITSCLPKSLLRTTKHSGRPRCAIKVDIKKAFDSVSWDFLIVILEVIVFPSIFIGWIKECITTPMFSVKVNGRSKGYFPAMRGVRQGALYPPICLC